MGYRLEIDMVGKKNFICCGKLFGYVEDNTKLLSCQWLINNEYLDKEKDTIYFGFGFEGNFVLRGYELKEFLSLYIKDLENFDQYDNDKLIQEINDYILKIEDDYDLYVLMWG